jgi:hypothetical protein
MQFASIISQHKNIECENFVSLGSENATSPFVAL